MAGFDAAAVLTAHSRLQKVMHVRHAPIDGDSVRPRLLCIKDVEVLLLPILRHREGDVVHLCTVKANVPPHETHIRLDVVGDMFGILDVSVVTHTFAREKITVHQRVRASHTAVWVLIIDIRVERAEQALHSLLHRYLPGAIVVRKYVSWWTRAYFRCSVVSRGLESTTLISLITCCVRSATFKHRCSHIFLRGSSGGGCGFRWYLGRGCFRDLIGDWLRVCIRYWFRFGLLYNHPSARNATPPIFRHHFIWACTGCANKISFDCVLTSRGGRTVASESIIRSN
mmetsp:Transcript_28900/g.59218  ORF Transcript_28900/g.59218 Transcript_28900/m.59218 type:complete len:284 (-) Transcript_28900:591-1442(-)